MAGMLPPKTELHVELLAFKYGCCKWPERHFCKKKIIIKSKIYWITLCSDFFIKIYLLIWESDLQKRRKDRGTHPLFTPHMAVSVRAWSHFCICHMVDRGLNVWVIPCCFFPVIFRELDCNVGQLGQRTSLHKEC